MKAIVLAAGLLGLMAADASAASRYEIARMGCGDVQAILRQEGAAILRWRSKRDLSLPLYGRYVRDVRFCNMGEVTEFASVPTADRRACPVKKCVMPERFDRFGRGRILIPD